MEKYNNGNKEAFFSILSDDHVYYFSGNPEVKGREGYKKFDSLVSVIFQTNNILLKKMVAEGDWVIVLYIFRGRFKGKFKDIAPTDNKVTLLGVGTYRFSNSKIVETWATRDILATMQQMGVKP